jgi:hypothetical protein
MAITLTAVQVPVPPIASGVYSPSSAPLCSETLITGDGPGGEVRVKGNKNATRIDLTGRIGGGGYAVYTGLDLSFTTGRTLTIAAGQAMIDGVVTIAQTTTTIDPNIARAYVWLARAGTITVVNNSLTPPAGAYCFLGSCVTNATDITSKDESGILYIKGGILRRETADTGLPGDTPPSGLQFFTETTNRLYFWDGSEYWLMSCGTAAATTGQLTKAITTSTTLAAADLLYASIRITDGGGLADGFVLTWPAASMALGDRWAVRNDSGKAGRLTLSSGGDYIYLDDDQQVILEYTDGELALLGRNGPRYKAVSISGTTTYTQFEQVEADHFEASLSGAPCIAQWPNAGALENRGRQQTFKNVNSGTTPVTLRTNGVTEDNAQTRLLPGETIHQVMNNSGETVRANTRPYTGIKGVTHDDSATYTMTDQEALGFILQVTGTLTATRNLAVPTVRDKAWVVFNNTSGGFAITVKTAAGTGVTIPNGSRTLLYCDGTNALPGMGTSVTTAGDVQALFTPTATGTVANTTSETTVLGAGIGSLTLPANLLVPGRTLRFKASGVFGTDAAAHTLNMKFKLGATSIVATGAQTPTAALTNRLWEMEVLLTCRTVGATGTVIAQGKFAYMAAGTGAPTWWEATSTATTTIDTTGTLAVDLSATWGAGVTASDTISCSNAALESLN